MDTSFITGEFLNVLVERDFRMDFLEGNGKLIYINAITHGGCHTRYNPSSGKMKYKICTSHEDRLLKYEEVASRLKNVNALGRIVIHILWTFTPNDWNTCLNTILLSPIMNNIIDIQLYTNTMTKILITPNNVSFHSDTSPESSSFSFKIINNQIITDDEALILQTTPITIRELEISTLLTSNYILGG